MEEGQKTVRGTVFPTIQLTAGLGEGQIAQFVQDDKVEARQVVGHATLLAATSVCANRTGISRQELEGRILTALSDRLMDPDLVEVFANEYIAERNRLAARHIDHRAVKEKELAKVIRNRTHW